MQTSMFLFMQFHRRYSPNLLGQYPFQCICHSLAILLSITLPFLFLFFHIYYSTHTLYTMLSFPITNLFNIFFICLPSYFLLLISSQCFFLLSFNLLLSLNIHAYPWPVGFYLNTNPISFFVFFCFVLLFFFLLMFVGYLQLSLWILKWNQWHDRKSNSCFPDGMVRNCDGWTLQLCEIHQYASLE